MDYEEITKITTDCINNYMEKAANANSEGVAGMFHNAAWGVTRLWFELVSKIDLDTHKRDRYANYELRREIERQKEEFNKMTDRDLIPLLKTPE